MIRPAVAGDAPAIAALWAPYLRGSLVTFNPDEKSPAEVAALIAARTAAGRAFLVAEAPDRPGEIAGFGSYDQFRGGAGYRFTVEHTLLLAPAAQGKGLGRALLAALEAHARQAGHRTMIAGVSGGNPQGRAFHLACGYREVAVLPGVGFKFGRWLDLHVLQKRL